MVKGKRSVATLALFVLVLLFAGLDPRVRLRVQMVGWKLLGQLPDTTWADLKVDLAPWSWRDFGNPVRFKKREGDSPCPVLFETPMGEFWARLKDRHILSFVIHEQVDQKIYDLPPAAVQEGDVVFDVGGHLGAFTRFGLNRGARLVVVFEPEPTNISCLKRTFASEMQQRRVVLIEAAAWHSAGTIQFSRLGHSGMGKVTDGGELVLPAVTIDETVDRLGLDRVDFIKMDIEGAERHALAGARRTLSRFAPRMALCTYHRPDDPEVVERAVIAARPEYHIIRKKQQSYFY